MSNDPAASNQDDFDGDAQATPKSGTHQTPAVVNIPELTRMIAALEKQLDLVLAQNSGNKMVQSGVASFRVARTKLRTFFGQNPGRIE